MDKSVEINVTLFEHIRFQKMSYEARYGKEPKFLVVNYDVSEQLFAECYRFIINTPSLKFENPVSGIIQFLGLNVIVIKEWYGNSNGWGFAN